MKHLGIDQLSQLLEDDDRRPSVEIETHLETCSRCQQTLSDLAAQGAEWNRVVEFLSIDDWNAEKEIPVSELSTQVRVETEGEPRPTIVPLTFLDEARHPELLGRLGKYDIESVIGQGGMGVVLKGFDPDLNRPVAIKVMAPWLATSGTARKRFAREAQAAAAVVHEHVVAIHGIESNGELPYLVMEYVGGESLQQYIDRNGPLETNEVLRIAAQVASGLAAAHEQGLVHRDVKPANILLHSHPGRVQITDFGLARAADDAALTFSGIIAGTPHYMSPEQAIGRGVDVRSDLFSLGTTIYLMATGRLPFRADQPMAVLNQICHEVPVAIRELNPDVPQHLADIVCKLLAKDPQDRFQSADDVKETATAYLAYRQHPLTTEKPATIRIKIESKNGTRDAIRISSVVICLLAAMWLGKTLVRPTLRSPTATHNGATKSGEVGQPDTAQSATGEPHLRLMPLKQFDDQLLQLTQQVEELRTIQDADSMFQDQWNERILSLDSQLSHLESDILSP